MARKPQPGYPAFPSIPRLNREVWITEKIDGTNGLIRIGEEPLEGDPYLTLGYVRVENTLYWVSAGSRNKWLDLGQDNHGFANWVAANGATLVRDLGPGLHYGEWWGSGINRGYGKEKGEKFFSLFNAYRWHGVRFETENLSCVPVLSRNEDGKYLSHDVDDALYELRDYGSYAAPGFNRPEGVVVYHDAAKQYFKVTLENDDKPKSLVKES